MEARTFDVGEFQLHLHYVQDEVGDFPMTMTRPPMYLIFRFGHYASSFIPPFWPVTQEDRDCWRQGVEEVLLNVLSRGGRRGSFDVSGIATAYCQYLDAVIQVFLMAPYGGRIVVEALITDAAYPPLTPATASPSPSPSPEDDWDSLECQLEVDVFGEGEAEKEYADVSCSICLNDFEEGELLYMMPCGHRFHMECLKKWLSRSYQCPLCRFCL